MRRLLCGAIAGLLSGVAAQALPAFPGAAGFGSDTPGGRGGRVIQVTNTRDSGRGSLRAAVETRGRRTIVFQTGGTITLQSTLEIREPFLTIAGQTAPGGGIQLRNDPHGSMAADSFPTLRISTHDVVLRYLRIRPGMLEPDPGCAGDRRPPRRCIEPNDIDAINLTGDARAIVIDHVSASWASDEIIGAGAARELTLQWSILSEGLNLMLYAPGKRFDGKGMLLGNTHEVARGHPSGHVSVHHNVWAHNSIRSPMLNNACAERSRPEACVVQIENNLVHNWIDMGTHVSNALGHAFANVVANYYKPGWDTKRKAPALGFRDWTATSPALRPGAALGLYLDGNVQELGAGPQPAAAECFRLGLGKKGRQAVLGACDPAVFVRSAYPAPNVRSGGALEVVEPVLREAGASARLDEQGAFVPARDAVDQRIVSDFRQGRGRVVSSLEALPAWPELAAGQPPADADRDGMPDAWERLHGLPAERASDPGADADADGYTDLEEFLNGTHPRQAGADSRQ